MSISKSIKLKQYFKYLNDDINYISLKIHKPKYQSIHASIRNFPSFDRLAEKLIASGNMNETFLISEIAITDEDAIDSICPVTSFIHNLIKEGFLYPDNQEYGRCLEAILQHGEFTIIIGTFNNKVFQLTKMTYDELTQAINMYSD